jgi:hypothetical protein
MAGRTRTVSSDAQCAGTAESYERACSGARTRSAAAARRSSKFDEEVVGDNRHRSVSAEVLLERGDSAKPGRADRGCRRSFLDRHLVGHVRDHDPGAHLGEPAHGRGPKPPAPPVTIAEALVRSIRTPNRLMLEAGALRRSGRSEPGG